MAEAGSHHLGAGVRAQASRQQPGLWGRGELQDQGQGPLGTAGATPEELFMPTTDLGKCSGRTNPENFL